MVKMADTADSKSAAYKAYGFESRFGHMRHRAYLSGGPKDREWHDREHIGTIEITGPVVPLTVEPLKYTDKPDIDSVIEFKTEVKGHYVPDHVVYRWVSASDNS